MTRAEYDELAREGEALFQKLTVQCQGATLWSIAFAFSRFLTESPKLTAIVGELAKVSAEFARREKGAS